MLLTDKAVRSAKPKDKPYRLRDGNGLFLQVQPSGSKYWRLRYFYLGKEKMLALGVDPSGQRKEDKRQAIFNAGNTFEAVAKE